MAMGIGAVFGLLSTVVGVAGSIAQGNAAQAQAEAQANMAEFEAKQFEIKAKEEVAASQRDALEKKREKDLVQSRLQATSAASGMGGGILDPTVVDLASDIEGQGDFNYLMVRYGGDERARGYRNQAAASNYEAKTAEMAGDIAQQGAMFSALGTMVGGLSSFAQKYSATPFSSGPMFSAPLQQKPSPYPYGYQ